MSVRKAILVELFAIVWLLYVGFMPQEWHGALSFGVLLGLVGVFYGFYADGEPPRSEPGGQDPRET